jgi:hypothetical protein
MPIALVRRPFDAEVHDDDAVRDALQERVRREIVLDGASRGAIVLVGDGYTEELDVEAMQREQPGAHLGATFAALERPGIERKFVSLSIKLTDEEQVITMALLIERGDDGEGPYWWLASLPFTHDPTQGIGTPGAWSAQLVRAGIRTFPGLQELFVVPPGATAAKVVAPRARQPDIKAAFHELPPNATIPADAMGMSDFAAATTVNAILRDGPPGIIVVKQAGRAVEVWILGDDLPSDLDDMIRLIARQNPPEAEAMALVQAALFDGEDPPRKGIQIVAQKGKERAERWVLLDFPEGQGGPRHIHKVIARTLPDCGEDEGWIGVEPIVDFDLTPLGPEA